MSEQDVQIPGRTRGRRETEESAEEAGETGKTAGESHKTDIIAKAERKRGGSVLTEFSLYRFEGSRDQPHGGLAQLEERVLCKHEVIGSSPIFSTIIWADSSAG